ncbi:MAG: hypothetical protein C4329_09415 [Chitinophagaceae bacterium]
MVGHRYRFEAGQYFGIVNLQSLLGDFRNYLRIAPLTFATRAMYMGRFGKDAESGVLTPFYIGNPYFIRGYEAVDFANESNDKVTINDLLGSRILVANAELRFPFTGPERLSAIRSRYFFSELNLFTDGGIAWGSAKSPATDGKGGLIPRESKFVMSTGVSMRINLFGYLVIEPYYAVPWQNGGFKNANFGLNFIPGW